WEEKKAGELKSMGLEQNGAEFSLKRPPDPGNELYALLDWLNEHADDLTERGFEIKQENPDRRYVIGRNLINLEFKENNDWFDIHAKVRFGEYEIPFLQLKNHILSRTREFELPDGKIA